MPAGIVCVAAWQFLTGSGTPKYLDLLPEIMVPLSRNASETRDGGAMRRGGVKKPPPQAAAINAAIKSRVIRGRVRWNVPSPPPGFRVTAFELRIGENDRVLGRTDLDLEGNYRLEFTPRLDETLHVLIKLANAQGRVIAESAPGKHSG